MSRVTYDAGNLTIEVDGLDAVAAALSHPDSLLYSGWLIFVIAVKICQEICRRINGASRRKLPFRTK